LYRALTLLTSRVSQLLITRKVYMYDEIILSYSTTTLTWSRTVESCRLLVECMSLQPHQSRRADQKYSAGENRPSSVVSSAVCVSLSWPLLAGSGWTVVERRKGGWSCSAGRGPWGVWGKAESLSQDAAQPCRHDPPNLQYIVCYAL